MFQLEGMGKLFKTLEDEYDKKSKSNLPSIDK